jgi:predicted transposase/invertase (TIGR01784 family)
MTTNKPKHDQLFRKALENPIVAREFIEAHLPKNVLAVMDTNTLKLEKESFVELDLANSVSDVLFSAKFQGRYGYIYILLEHQSTVSRFMAFRLFKYMVNICDRYMREHKKSKYLPLVYPIVIYNGAASFNAPRNLWDLFSDKILAKNFWVEDYQLVNVHEIPDEELKKRIWSGI